MIRAEGATRGMLSSCRSGLVVRNNRKEQDEMVSVSLSRLGVGLKDRPGWLRKGKAGDRERERGKWRAKGNDGLRVVRLGTCSGSSRVTVAKKRGNGRFSLSLTGSNTRKVASREKRTGGTDVGRD